jgi:hypothetical protein
LGAFPAAPETGLCGAPLFAPAPARCAVAASHPSNPLRASPHPRGERVLIDFLAIDYDKYNKLKNETGYIYKTIEQEGQVLY